MDRIRNWDVKLVQWAKDMQTKDFEWGTRDCATLVLKDAFEVMYGEPVFTDLPNWTTRLGLMRASTKVGGPKKYLSEKGAEEVTRNYVQGGDIIIDNSEDFPHLALVLNKERVLFASEENGIHIEKFGRLSPDLTIMRYK